jgi:hypothetical protein
MSNKTVGAILAAQPQVLARPVRVFFLPICNIEATIIRIRVCFSGKNLRTVDIIVPKALPLKDFLQY